MAHCRRQGRSQVCRVFESGSNLFDRQLVLARDRLYTLTRSNQPDYGGDVHAGAGDTRLDLHPLVRQTRFEHRRSGADFPNAFRSTGQHFGKV